MDAKNLLGFLSVFYLLFDNHLPLFFHQKKLHRHFVSLLEIFHLIDTILVDQSPSLIHTRLLSHKLVIPSSKRTTINEIAGSIELFTIVLRIIVGLLQSSVSNISTHLIHHPIISAEELFCVLIDDPLCCGTIDKMHLLLLTLLVYFDVLVELICRFRVNIIFSAFEHLHIINRRN